MKERRCGGEKYSSIGGAFSRLKKARTYQLWFEKGHFVCPEVCDVRNVCVSTADYARERNSKEKKRLLSGV
jgi:hypothetical protein